MCDGGTGGRHAPEPARGPDRVRVGNRGGLAGVTGGVGSSPRAGSEVPRRPGSAAQEPGPSAYRRPGSDPRSTGQAQATVATAVFSAARAWKLAPATTNVVAVTAAAELATFTDNDAVGRATLAATGPA